MVNNTNAKNINPDDLLGWISQAQSIVQETVREVQESTNNGNFTQQQVAQKMDLFVHFLLQRAANASSASTLDSQIVKTINDTVNGLQGNVSMLQTITSDNSQSIIKLKNDVNGLTENVAEVKKATISTAKMVIDHSGAIKSLNKELNKNTESLDIVFTKLSELPTNSTQELVSAAPPFKSCVLFSKEFKNAVDKYSKDNGIDDLSCNEISSFYEYQKTDESESIIINSPELCNQYMSGIDGLCANLFLNPTTAA